MAANGVFQFKKPPAAVYRCTAKEYMCFDPHILDQFTADDLVDIYTQKLMFFIFHTESERSNVTIGTANRYYIHRTIFF
jgi:hypothetical protein